MKKIIIIVIAVCVIVIINYKVYPSHTNESSNCKWQVYEAKITDGNWALRINYDNNCNYSIRVKVKVEVAYKERYCDDPWSYKTKTIYRDLIAHRRNASLLGGSSFYDDGCKARYKLTSVSVVD